MAINTLDASGVSGGQALRLDLAPEIHPEPIPGSNLPIPNHGADRTRQDRRTNPSGEGQWKKQEALTHDQSRIREQKGANWRDFNGNHRRRSVELTTSGLGGVESKGPPKPEGTKAGPTRMKNWPEHAARFEEKIRDHGENVGIHASIDLPSGDTSPNTPVSRRVGRRNFRRQFNLG